jgi:hypothetical protein
LYSLLKLLAMTPQPVTARGQWVIRDGQALLANVDQKAILVMKVLKGTLA